MQCDPVDSAIRELLLNEDYNLHDLDDKNGLLKIEYIDVFELIESELCQPLETST